MPKLKTLIFIAIVGGVLIALQHFGFLSRTLPETATPTIEWSPTEPPPTEPTSPPTERPQIIAVVTEIATCYSGDHLEFPISVSEHVIVGILEKSENNDVVQVRLNEKIDCWMPLSTLKLAGLGGEVPIAPAAPTLPAPTAIPTSEPTTVLSTPPPPLAVAWKMLSYDCGNNGRAVGAMIDLVVSGGVPEYRFSRNVPVYARPGEFLSITVNSNTEDEEPSRIINFTVPVDNDRNWYKCERPGNVDDGDNPAPQPPEQVCTDKKGNPVPCEPEKK